MRYYDLTYLISPDLNQEEAKKLSEQIIGSLQQDGAILDRTRVPGKIKLAYPIKKKEEAYLCSLNFSISPEKIKNLREKIKSEKEILRFLLFSQKMPKAKISLKMAKPPRKKPLEKKVELKEIEKKLEEILGSVHEGEPKAKPK